MATLFGTDATTLQAAQGAGSAPLAPVQDPSWSNKGSALMDFAGNALGAYAEYKVKQTKDEKPWMAQRNQYQKELNTLQQQYQTAGDSITSKQVLTKMRQLTTQYQADGAAFGIEYSKAISDTYTYARTGTGIEELETLRENDVKRQDDAINNMVKTGVFASQGGDLTEEQRGLAIQLVSNQNALELASKKVIDAEDRVMKKVAHGQSVTTFDQNQETFFAERAAQLELGNYLATGFDVVSSNLDTYRSEVKADGSNYAEVLSKFQLTLEPMRAEAASVLQFNPQAASAFNSSMDRITKLGVDMLDPKKRTEGMENEFKRLILAEKLRIANLQTGVTTIAMNELTQGLAVNMVASSKLGARAYKEMDEMTSNNIMPSLVTGETEVQRPILKTLENGIVEAAQGKGRNAQAALEDGIKSHEAVLNSFGSLSPDKPVTLSYAIDYLASGAPKAIIEAGRYNEAANTKALAVFQETYLTGVGKNVQNYFGTRVGEATYVDGSADPTQTPSVINLVSFEMDATGSIRVKEDRDPRMKFVGSTYYMAKQVREAQKQADDMSRTVKAAAHMMGTTNYQDVWIDLRAAMMPYHFPTRDKVKEAMNDGWNGKGSMFNGASWNKRDTDAVAK